MTKNNTAAVKFHRCSRMRMQWIPGALSRQPHPAICRGAEAIWGQGYMASCSRVAVNASNKQS